MRDATKKNIDKYLEQARVEGYAVVGFAIHPEAGGIMRLDNQHMNREQFIAMMGEALNFYSNHTTDNPMVIAEA